jgi:hypothetical protein
VNKSPTCQRAANVPERAGSLGTIGTHEGTLNVPTCHMPIGGTLRNRVRTPFPPGTFGTLARNSAGSPSLRPRCARIPIAPAEYPGVGFLTNTRVRARRPNEESVRFRLWISATYNTKICARRTSQTAMKCDAR